MKFSLAAAAAAAASLSRLPGALAITTKCNTIATPYNGATAMVTSVLPTQTLSATRQVSTYTTSTTTYSATSTSTVYSTSVRTATVSAASISSGRYTTTRTSVRTTTTVGTSVVTQTVTVVPTVYVTSSSAPVTSATIAYSLVPPGPTLDSAYPPGSQARRRDIQRSGGLLLLAPRQDAPAPIPGTVVCQPIDTPTATVTAMVTRIVTANRLVRQTSTSTLTAVITSTQVPRGKVAVAKVTTITITVPQQTRTVTTTATAPAATSTLIDSVVQTDVADAFWNVCAPSRHQMIEYWGAPGGQVSSTFGETSTDECCQAAGGHVGAQAFQWCGTASPGSATCDPSTPNECRMYYSSADNCVDSSFTTKWYYSRAGGATAATLQCAKLVTGITYLGPPGAQGR